MPRDSSPDYLETDDEIDEFAQEENIGLWEKDEWTGGEDSEEDEGVAQDLAQIPLSVLSTARKHIAQPKASSSSVDRVSEARAKLAELRRRKGKLNDDGDDDDEAHRQSTSWSSRSSKHAPTALSTKKQVSRHRQVVDVPKTDRRDPRFSQISAGAVDPHLHQQSYSFLPDMMSDELATLRQELAAALKAEKTCARSEQPRWTEERERLERRIGKARTRLERTEREGRERTTLTKAKKEEMEKRKQGKGAWHMKKGAQRDLLLTSRFESLEQRGGKLAVRKAMDKKRKKIAGKEKKSRPNSQPGDSSRRAA